MWHQPCNNQAHHFGGYSKMHYKKLVTHSEPHVTRVQRIALLKSNQQQDRDRQAIYLNIVLMSPLTSESAQKQRIAIKATNNKNRATGKADLPEHCLDVPFDQRHQHRQTYTGWHQVQQCRLKHNTAGLPLHPPAHCQL